MKLPSPKQLHRLQAHEIDTLRATAQRLAYPPAYRAARMLFIGAVVFAVLCLSIGSLGAPEVSDVGIGAAVLAAAVFVLQRLVGGNRENLPVPPAQLEVLRTQLRPQSWTTLKRLASRLTHDGPGDGIVRVRTLWIFLSESVPAEADEAAAMDAGTISDPDPVDTPDTGKP